MERSICECDKEFASTVDRPDVNFQNFNLDACVPFPTSHSRLLKSGGCCFNDSSGLFTWYNQELRDCCATGDVRTIGEC
jgi:hypothetical protein